MSDRIEHYVMGAESTTVVNAPPTSVATGPDPREVIERLMARIEDLTLAGDGLQGALSCVLGREGHVHTPACITAAIQALGTWEKAKE